MVASVSSVRSCEDVLEKLSMVLFAPNTAGSDGSAHWCIQESSALVGATEADLILDVSLAGSFF